MATAITVTGAYDAPVSLTDNAVTAYGTYIGGQISAAIADGALVAVDYAGTGAAPAASGIAPYYLIDTISGSDVAEPVGYAALLIAALGGATVEGNGAANQSVLGGVGPMTYADDGGSGEVVATARHSQIFVDGLTGNGYQIYADAMNDTVIAGTGLTSITLETETGTGVSGDLVGLGAGTAYVQTGADDTVFGGSGTAYIDANRTLVVAGAGETTIQGNGTDTILAPAAGQSTVTTTGGELISMGASTVTLQDTPLVKTGVFTPAVDTVFAGAGLLLATVSGNSALIVGGAGGGTIRFVAQPLGSAAQPLSTIGASTVFGLGSTVDATGGAPVFAASNTPGGDITYSATANSTSFYTGDADLFVGGTGGGNVLTAGAGNSTLFAGGAGDVLSAAYAGADILVGASGAETLSGLGATGDDSFFGGGGPDLIRGGSGDDVIVAGAGSNTISTGEGHNLVFLGAGASTVNSLGTDTIVGGAGAATVSVGGGSLVFGQSGPLTLLNAAGTSTLVGGAGSVTVYGGNGGGLFAGGAAGSNLLISGAGATTLLGAGGGDVLIAAGAGGDFLVAGAGAETLNAIGSQGNNILAGSSGPDLLEGGHGQDTFLAGSGNETLNAGIGADLFVVAAGAAGHAGGQLTIAGFKVGADHLSLTGYVAGTAEQALSNAVVANGNEMLTLPDATTIIFENVTNLNAGSFV